MKYPPVTVYSQPSCRPCKRVLSKLDGAEVNYELVDVTENEDARTYVTQVLKASSVPVVVTDDPAETMIGYDPTRLNAIIDKYKPSLGVPVPNLTQNGTE